MYAVGLGESPMSIARKFTGNPYRHFELLAANPHKPIVYVGGLPTFASMQAGEPLALPASYGVGGIFDVITAPVRAVATVVTAPVKAAGKVVTTVVKETGKAAAGAVKTIGESIAKVPVLGDVTRIASDAATAPFRLARDVASGARLDKALLKSAKDQVRIVREAAPYAQAVISVVPGIGTGVSAAVGAGVALAEGRDIDEIAKEAIRGALPGGPAAAAAFDTATDIATGKNVGKAALENARNLIPAGARQAFDIGLSIATGENIQTALAREFAQMVPAQLDNIASGWVKSLDSAALYKLTALMPKDITPGFTIAMGALSHEGVSPKALRALRATMSGKKREGFDLAIKSVEKRMPGITAALEPPPKRRPPVLKPKKAAPVRKPPTLRKELSPKRKEELRQLAALKKLSPEEQKALAALSPEEREQLRKIAKLSPEEREQLRKIAEAKTAAPPPPPAAVVAPPAPAALRAFQYGPYPQA